MGLHRLNQTLAIKSQYSKSETLCDKQVAALISLQIYTGEPPRAPEGFWFISQLKMERSVLAASHYIVLTIRRGFKLIKPLIFRHFLFFFKASIICVTHIGFDRSTQII